MENCFLNKKILFICILFYIFSSNVFSETDYTLTKIEGLRSCFLTGQDIDINKYEAFLDSTIMENDLSDNKIMVQLLDCFILYSNIQTTNSTTESVKRIKNFEELIFPYIQKNTDSDVLNQYCSYLYSKISWSNDSFSIIEKLPYWYKKNIQLNHDSLAELFYSIWLINAVTSNESNWISYIKQKENLIEEIEIKKYDLFNCYLAYSIFYMKIHNTQKGFEYLNKAELLYPNNYECAILEMNYMNGRFSW